MDFFVTNTADSGPGSLRQAIMDANGNPGPDRILIQTTGTVLLLSALPDITDSVEILGPGAGSFTVDGNAAFRPFRITAPAIVTITGIAVRRHRQRQHVLHGLPVRKQHSLLVWRGHRQRLRRRRAAPLHALA